ncbi:MAG: hypothetical protein FJ044_02605 [Candidatus Cloacimonetes bacterium]|nr:hypothetical protein [Candidatus Cloacimonadota bacterium]
MRNFIISWFLPILSTTIVMVIVIALILPWTKDFFAKRKEINESEKQINEVLQPKLSFLQTLDKQALRIQLTNLELILPSKVQAPFIFATIESLAAANNVLVEGLIFSLPTKGANEVINLSFIASGESDSLNNFVNSLEKTAPFLAITNYRQTKSEGEPDSALVAVSSFYKTLPEKVGGVSEPLEGWTKKELEALQKVNEFKTPAVSLSEEVLTQTIPLGKPNPF